VTVVAKNDQEDLFSGLDTELKNKALDELSALVSADQKVIPESLTTTVLDKSFDREINQEAAELKLNLKSEFSVLTYSPAELKEIIKSQLAESILSGFEYDDDQDEVKFSLKNVTPRGVVVADKIKIEILGKRPQTAQQYLASLDKVRGVKIKIRPAWLGPLTTFPHLAQNIKIEMEVE
jgi:hypothetical protein